MERTISALPGMAGRKPFAGTIYTDTSDFFRIDQGDIVCMDGHPYLVSGHEKEGRFGLDEEPKLWVKRSIDLYSGKIKILKLEFQESFQLRVGDVTYDFFRSPAKEARILDLVHGDRRFMQGASVADEKGNIVRILDFIPGMSLAESVLRLGRTYEEYYFDFFPFIFRIFIELVEGIARLHLEGEKHGDIRRDHVIVDSKSGECRWIDFDYSFRRCANPYRYDIFGLGNILVYLTGRGDVTWRELPAGEDRASLQIGEGDFNVVFRNRLVNLGKVYPFIAAEIAILLTPFSAGAQRYYEHIGEFLEDLHTAAGKLPHRKAPTGWWRLNAG